MEEATELTTASKLKNIFAVVIMVLAVLKALILALTLFHVPVLGGASYEALTSSSMIKGPAFGAWLNLITGLMVILLLGYVGLHGSRMEVCIGVGLLAALNIGMHAGKLFVASGWSPVTVFFVIYCVALTVFSVATYIIAAHRRALERNQQNEEE